MKLLFTIVCTTLLISCTKEKNKIVNSDVFLVVLGNVQDAGSPQIGCKKECCSALFLKPDFNRKVTSLGIIDKKSGKKFLFEATPDMASQVRNLHIYNENMGAETPDGVFLTHAHIGHYTGLMLFGKEAMNATKIPTYVMPKMKTFLSNNGPWSQLVANKNIALKELQNETELQLTPNIKIIPFLVPHRDEFSETVGYKIIGPNKSALFIPDIDKWEKWEKDIVNQIKKVDYAFIDATFFDAKELNNRDISQIPHPFVSESMQKFSALSDQEKKKIIFIHFNHTNKLLKNTSNEYKKVIKNGYNVASLHNIFNL